MKKILIIVLAVVIITGGYLLLKIPNNKSSYKCSDSDGGKDYYVKGLTQGSYDSPSNIIGGPDECSIRGTTVSGCIKQEDTCRLIEHYCKNNQVAVEEHKCPNGCDSGSCIK